MADLRFDNRGLITAVVQHARSGEVLMVGYMNQQSLDMTRETGEVTFWSRSRNEIWRKGATSGNVLRLVEIRVDCDADALLVLAEPAGPTCHTGARSCFSQTIEGRHSPEPAVPQSYLPLLFDLLQQRNRERPAESYSTYLLDKGVDKICKKIGEEAAEVIVAAKNRAPQELTAELADLVFHSFVLLVEQGLAPEAIWEELSRRQR